MNDNNQAWESYSQEYQCNCFCAEYDFHYALCIGGEKDYRLLPDLEGTNVCDVGSGTGENAAYLAKSARVVVGIDPSIRFVETASERYKELKNLSFKCADFLNFEIETDGPKQFDLITFIQSLDYMVLNSAFFSKLDAITRRGSRIVISRMHPMWTTLFDHELDEVHLERSYFYSRVDRVSYGKSSFLRVHYSLDELIESFAVNGWHLERLKEPRPVPKERAALIMGQCYEDDLLMKRMSRYPMTLLMRFERID